jgi:hypothetical protein
VIRKQESPCSVGEIVISAKGVIRRHFLLWKKAWLLRTRGGTGFGKFEIGKGKEGTGF